MMDWIGAIFVIGSLITASQTTTPRGFVLSVLGLLLGWSLIFTSTDWGLSKQINQLRERMSSLEQAMKKP